MEVEIRACTEKSPKYFEFLSRHSWRVLLHRTRVRQREVAAAVQQTMSFQEGLGAYGLLDNTIILLL